MALKYYHQNKKKVYDNIAIKNLKSINENKLEIMQDKNLYNGKNKFTNKLMKEMVKKINKKAKNWFFDKQKSNLNN